MSLILGRRIVEIREAVKLIYPPFVVAFMASFFVMQSPFWRLLRAYSGEQSLIKNI
jgi:hypothetical protein